MDNLSLSSDKKNFVVVEDDISVSTFRAKSFYRDKVSFELDLEKEEISLLYLDNNSISDRNMDNTAHTTEETIEETRDTVVQDSQSTKGYGKSLALE